MPVVDLSGKPVDETVCISIAEKSTEHFGFTPEGHDIPMTNYMPPQKVTLAHIRFATVGNINQRSCRPFTGTDISGREWTQCIYNRRKYEL